MSTTTHCGGREHGGSSVVGTARCRGAADVTRTHRGLDSRCRADVTGSHGGQGSRRGGSSASRVIFYAGRVWCR